MKGRSPHPQDSWVEENLARASLQQAGGVSDRSTYECSGMTDFSAQAPETGRPLLADVRAIQTPTSGARGD